MTVHDALQSLGPVSFADISLPELARKTFEDATTIVNSVPLATKTLGDEEMQKEWGKPVKVSAKENPFDMTFFKMTGKDGRGAWFSRSSVHSDFSFDHWRHALLNEFPESLKIEGGPGEGNIRGIGAEKRVEHRTIDETGTVSVYHLSAQFPGPTTPRDFVTLLLVSQSPAPQGQQIMIVSRPCEHNACPPRDDFIRGQYESVEVVREIGDESVVWIMVTRSDPGGSVPRFMVERGTPSGIAGDAVKFIDWMRRLEHNHEDRLASAEDESIVAQTNGESREPPTIGQTLSSFTSQMMPQKVLDMMAGPQVSSSSSDTSSMLSFASARGSPTDAPTPAHARELTKLNEKKQALDEKLANLKAGASGTPKEGEIIRKAEQKHAEQVARHEERYHRDLARIEARQEKERTKKDKEAAKERHKQRKAEEKDDRVRLSRALEETKGQLEQVTEERNIVTNQMQALQRENTALVARLGRIEGGSALIKDMRGDLATHRPRSTSNLLRRTLTRRSDSQRSVEAVVLDAGSRS